MESYAIGLDVGISSVGWAVLALDNEENPMGIIDMGSRIFDAAEQPKTGESLAAPRREARSVRRRIRRHRHRNERIRALIVRENLLTEDALRTLFDGALSDIYELRVKALDEKVTQAEFTRILLHISQRRGFKSNRKQSLSKEDGKLLEAVNINKQRMQDHGYRTVGEMLLKDPAFSDHRRNKGEEYVTTVTRDMTEDEVHAIFSAQRALGNDFTTEELEEAYLEILLSQRSFDEGPGGSSPYGGNQIERMIGRCTFLPDEPRAAKAAYSFEYFSLLEKINHIRIISEGKSDQLTQEQREKIIELAFSTKDVSFRKIRKALSLPESCRFNLVGYAEGISDEDAEKKEKLKCMRAYHEMRAAIEKNAKGRFLQISTEQRNAIGTTLSIYKTDVKIREHLRAAGLEECDIDALESVENFSQFGHLSVKACDRIIPFLEQGMNYNEACKAAGFDFKGHDRGEKHMLLHPTEDDYRDITSPVVKRAISQTVKVVNAIIRSRGCSPMFLNIELAREMAKNFEERNKLKKEQEQNRTRNEQVAERIRNEFGHSSPTGIDIVKFKLWQEQDGICAYSLKPIAVERLFEADYAEVDHIIPYSISFDDRYANKVLVLAKENRDKGNRLPMQYLTGEKKENFVVWVNNSVRNSNKRKNLLKEELTEEDEKKFSQRNLQDTKTVSRFLLNYFNDHLTFARSACGRKKKVTAVNGAVTDYMRKRWGIVKIRGNGDLHHAVDAVVVACTTDAMIRQVSLYQRYRECQYMQTDSGSIAIDSRTGEVLRKFPYPWAWFRKELEARLSKDPAETIREWKIPLLVYDGGRLPGPLFVSRMPRRKITGAAHKDTVKGNRLSEEGVAIVKRPLTALKLKNGEIENYYMPQNDPLLYNALKQRLTDFDGDAKKAFKEPFHKPKGDGTPGAPVKKVKLCEPSTLSVPVHGGTGMAENDKMVRIDVFYVEKDGYYFVPIYVADTLRKELPDKACVAHKPYSGWKPMNEDDFVFSLYPNDLIRITHKKEFKLTKAVEESTLPDSRTASSELLYYRGADIATASISCITHDHAYEARGLGIKTLKSIEKYTVDVLGNYYKVGREKRQKFDLKRG